VTPEAGGVTSATRTGPDYRPIDGYVQRTTDAARLMIGGRHLGEEGDGAATLELAADGRVLDRWTVTASERNFLRFVDVPAGALDGAGRYATLTVRADRAAARRADVAVRQFDIAPASVLVWGFGEGWHEAESVFETGLQWRWASERAVLEVRGPARALRVTVRGESPLRYFAAAPHVKITAAGETVATLEPARDFTWSVDVPAARVAASGGRIAIETDRVFVPAHEGTSADARHLGLRIYDCSVTPLP
jgi:hypothetical protein